MKLCDTMTLRYWLSAIPTKVGRRQPSCTLYYPTISVDMGDIDLVWISPIGGSHDDAQEILAELRVDVATASAFADMLDVKCMHITSKGF